MPAQIPPLRCFGPTARRGRRDDNCERSAVEKHFQERSAELQIGFSPNDTGRADDRFSTAPTALGSSSGIDFPALPGWADVWRSALRALHLGQSLPCHFSLLAADKSPAPTAGRGRRDDKGKSDASIERSCWTGASVVEDLRFPSPSWSMPVPCCTKVVTSHSRRTSIPRESARPQHASRPC